MHNPVATYRLQFHKEFTFQDFERTLSYLQKLGVSTIYASPIFEATPGSTHGYDGVNPHHINPEIGTEEELRTLANGLKEQGISWLQDIVPNHMAFHPNNPWLMDVLEKGPMSQYHAFFDINWSCPLYNGRVMVPFLGAPLAEAIQNGELKVGYDEAQKRLVFNYYGSAYPLNIRSYDALLKDQGASNQAVKQLLDRLQEIHQEEDAKALFLKWEEFKQQLAALMKNPETSPAIVSQLEAINTNQEWIQELTSQQVYQLCHWQETDAHINFRRFFTVNGLICLNVQDPHVFDTYHQYIKELLDQGIFQGLRIDHVDGLYDPTGYLNQLRELAGPETYISVEKILEPGETMPDQWPIQGNTGYDFLSYVNNLFTYSPGQETFNKLYQELVGEEARVHDQIHEKKAFILQEHMGGELENLFQLFLSQRLVQEDVLSTVSPEELKAAIGEFLVQCPVYRYYGNQMPLEKDEAEAVQVIFNGIRNSKPDLSGAVEILERALLGASPEGEDDTYLERSQRFYQRLMQFTGPLMAKGVEDTIMYTYNRFIGHNEVGDAPESFGMSSKQFHQLMDNRQKHWPLSLNGTSTHDTKRGEDVRARLNVLTELSEEWASAVQEWRKLNADLKQNNAPDANDEYLIYQTLYSAYPMAGEEENGFAERLQEYLQKALREAKTHSNWTTPYEAYEAATKEFAVKLLDQGRPFWNHFQDFRLKTMDYGIANSLSQVLLKFTAPGIPDVYQGTELWDFSLVDPDNRRPVDYKKRQAWLEELDSYDLNKQEALWEDLWTNRTDAHIKLWLTRSLFTERKNNADLFAKGVYLPLEVEGEHKDHVLAFARKHLRTWYVVAVPLHLAALAKKQGVETLQEIDWQDTKVLLPKDAPKDWQDPLLRGSGQYAHELKVSDLFRIFPLALLKLETKNERGAGILLHITTLASSFGIGDLGPEARRFADFLQASNQKYWQLLPLNPVEAGQGYSPYSSISSRAGNPLLISPELLAKECLLQEDELSAYHLPQTGSVDYELAKRVKEELLEKAWQQFNAGDYAPMQQQFTEYCLSEAGWLHDFSLYVLLKEQNKGQAWFQWEEPFRQRDASALEAVSQQHVEALTKIKWVQFLFDQQWKRLRTYCNNRGIQMFGDMPFYISYDSVDVWSNRDIFAVDDAGQMTGVAGVPPDSFSEDGQLWGMPVFKWDVLKAQNYDWWIGRLRKNMELYDLVRLDHFRAFADYWEVPAGEQTAKNGVWQPGPGADFFTVVEKELGSLPFIAEDLGEINDSVLKLRDDFNLPGMKILQFAWGEDMPQNDYMPHNYARNFIAYTGTHDNNTTLGWYRQEGSEFHQQIEHYVGRELSEEDIYWVMARLAYASVAKTAILPMQDVLGIDEQGRMNTPGQAHGNWGWRLMPGQINKQTQNQLKEWTWLYNRG
ncbi:malto-oligosyltrehalose synthase [Rufibacter sp. DG15C]|uniref:malto-oligosyltrehalose synthase n=1 Tax=Rufibacter sp. DG15C TaxID=1379909 RepID=UPI00078B7330|nr:malto-oligosyltrehalose synthase [Rufibacter sp. DG15C]AMM52322.1 malto-oligosyltrehalose synthase [Rufibacter sp. DG15C]